MSQETVPFDITVQELKEWRERSHPHRLIDVRQPNENTFANIGGELIPLNTLPQHVSELDPEEEIVVYCHMGGRSAMATEFLRRNGFPNARNLKGGITAWSKEIDPSIPTY